MHGHLRLSALVLAACIGSGLPALAQDDAELALGKANWSRAGCSNCHGSVGQGGDGGDYPQGPPLKTTVLDKETMTLIVSCGIPGTPMPAWRKGAYVDFECYGEPLGHRPDAGVTTPGALSGDDITALVDYIFATFVQTPQQ